MFWNQEQVNGIIIPRFRMLCAMKRNIRSQSQFRYRANSIMVDHEGLAEYKKKKKENDIPRIAKAKARDIYNGIKLIAEHRALEDPSEHSEKWKRISKNLSDGVLTKKSLRAALIKEYQAQEQPSTEVHSTQGDGGYSLDFLLGSVSHNN
ncbi:uncharacterized protein LOC133740199 isoform X1 [Rosa rugosa]|uniref:uncharacterized protein LOC133740199 isoform X1 n=2 Tax=Rosa rugosa TaxID=74645 RepID=UPI002B413779|nr:uncharacterized protein LOC133740199 isoform X1 [Rosa rugosa]